MVCEKIKNLRGESRRNFLRLTTAMGAALALDQSEILNVIADLGGTALAQDKKATAMRSIHFNAGNGGFAWFQLLWPHVEIAKGNNDNFAFHAFGQTQDATDTDKPFVRTLEAPFWDLGPKKRMSAFMSGTNQTHTSTAASAVTLNGGQGMIAAVAAIQRLNPSLLPVIAVEPFVFGAAQGAPAVTTVGDAEGMVDLFNSAASRLTLQVQEDAALFEAYYKAFVGLAKASSRPTVARQLRTGKSAANFLGQNLASQLMPQQMDLDRYGVTAGTPNRLSQIARTLITTAKAFKLGLTNSVILPAFRDDPHGAFQNMGNLQSTVADMGRYLAEFHKDLETPDPLDANSLLSDNFVLTFHGDTPKNPRNRDGWPDGTPNNSNWLYVFGNGYLKTGWFGRITPNEVYGWDPTTGQDVLDQASSMTSASASAAVLFAVTKGDMNRVKDFYNGPAIDGVVNASVL
ncbi:MAG TPA: twin-arginine translocation signal domain-containing protein [Candidatus Nanopelagicales bacterium]|nr:twin-arginine translocation signal domain-containing protein [Candidatus Nanopelagicales bacterium]